MSAAGLSDVYRYGVRFVGYLLAVTLVAGVFVGGGVAIVGTQGLSSVTGGGATGPVVAAIALVAIGVLLLLSGLSGLAYKLVADATMAGLVQGRAVDVAATETADATDDEEAATDDDTTEDTAGATGAAPPATDTVDDESSSDGTDDVTETVREEPEPAEGGTGTDSPPEPSTDEQTVVESPEPESQPEPPADATGTDEAVTPADAAPRPDEPVLDDESGAVTEKSPTETTDSTEWVEQSTTAGEDDGIAASDPESAGTTESDSGPTETQPEEWSPPDPSEFETAVPAESEADDSGATGPTDESSSAEESPGWEMEESGDESPDTPRTADDLFGETDDDGGEESVEDVSGLFSGDEETPEGDSGDDEGPEDPDDEPGESTPFETKSDSDPLSDALEDS
ncbi:hypothetical protein [Haloarcula rara]|uniref:hypothetical protein n=1 Tax=Haloarcula rara TaxID=3033387 RepID=UPI0023E764F0|nr:hypothetical protein [Halomicroarcula sp. SHR3]